MATRPLPRRVRRPRKGKTPIRLRLLLSDPVYMFNPPDLTLSSPLRSLQSSPRWPRRRRSGSSSWDSSDSSSSSSSSPSTTSSSAPARYMLASPSPYCLCGATVDLDLIISTHDPSDLRSACLPRWILRLQACECGIRCCGVVVGNLNVLGFSTSLRSEHE